MLSSFCLFTEVYQRYSPEAEEWKWKEISFIYSVFPEIVIEYLSCFPGSSVGKEPACKAGDPGLIPGSGSSPGEGIGYPLQHSWASLVVQMVKNLPAVWETWVGLLGWEDPLEKGTATHSSIPAWRIPWTEEPGMLYSPWGHKKSNMTEWLTHTHNVYNFIYLSHV